MRLEDWGWDERWAAAFAARPGRGMEPARVIGEGRGLYRVVSAKGEAPAKIPGAFRHKAGGRGELPAVGDWTAVEPISGDRTLQIRQILPRRTKLSRKASGEAPIEQVIAANLDTVFVTTSLNQDFNPRRLERFMTVSRESGAEPVLLLNKLDLCPDPAPFLEEARAVAAGAVIVPLSAKTGYGIEELAAWIMPGRTVGFVGTSGVGKSTLVNRLLGEERVATRDVRAGDDRGRHMTTRREMFVLEGGGVLLDTPGMREMQFWDADRGLELAFPEIDQLSPRCRFTNCRHETEPGCAVAVALAEGRIAAERYASWRKLRGELEARAKAKDPAETAAEKRRARQMNKERTKRPGHGR